MKAHFIASDFDLTPELEKYARHKMAEITRRVPRALRAQASCTIQFDQKLTGETKFNTCTIVMVLPDTELHSRETTSHMYAALDIASVNINQQLRDYAVHHGAVGVRARLVRRPKAESE